VRQLRPSDFIDIENMAPRPAQPSAAFAGGGSCWQAQQLVMQCGGEHVQQMHLGTPLYKKDSA
jgi:hypothetical protein